MNFKKGDRVRYFHEGYPHPRQNAYAIVRGTRLLEENRIAVIWCEDKQPGTAPVEDLKPVNILEEIYSVCLDKMRSHNG